MIYVIGPGPRRAGHGGAHLSRRIVYRALSGDRAQPERPAPAVPPVLLALRHSQPRRAGDAGLDPRGRRTRLFAAPCLWRGVRQSGSDRRLRHRRRRGGNRRAGRQLAFQQVSEPGARRRGAADPASQRLQDRQSDGAGAHRPRRADRSAARLRLRAAFRRGRRSGGRCISSSPATLDTVLARIREIQACGARRRARKARSARAGR